MSHQEISASPRAERPRALQGRGFWRRIFWIGMLFLISGMAAGVPAVASDWQQFRGPSRDGISTEKNLVTDWGDAGPKELWRRPIGASFSTIAAVDNRLFTLDSDPAEAENAGEYALALDAHTGETLWRRRIGELFTEGFGDGPRSGPAWHDGRLFVLSSRGNFHALDAQDGRVLWSVDFKERFGAEVQTWAFTSAPLVIPDLKRVVVEIGGTEGRAVAAFSLDTGEPVWTAIDDRVVYSSPVEMELHGVRQWVFLTQSGLWSLDQDGKTLWRAPFVPKLNIKPAAPVFVAPDLVFVSASYDAGAKVVRVKKSETGFEAEDVWQHQLMRNHFNGSVVLDDHLIGFDKATLKSIDAKTGEKTWAARGLGMGSLIRTDDLLIILSERGKLVLAEASTESYKPLAQHQVLTGRCWTQPTLADGRLYVRNGAEIVALDLRADAPSLKALATGGES